MKVLNRSAIALAVFVATLLFSAVASADDPRLDYRTITTDHFWVHYHTGTEALAWKVAVACEEAHEILTPLLDWTPGGRTHVVVNDKIDTANGSAIVFGRRQINVFGMPPESDSVLGFYDDWIRVLVFHEYVHILHLDTIVGFPPLVNAVLGKQWIPNQTAPRWYIEGLATYYESATTRGGRVDGSLFKMYLRVAALNETFFDLGGISASPVDWPRGTVAYLYGGFFLDYVFRKHTEQFGTDFNHQYGGRVLPWALNSISNDISGESFAELYQEWTAAEQGRAVAKQVAVDAQGATALDVITDRGGGTGWPRLRPGTNEVWFYYFDHERAPCYSSVLTTGANLRCEFEVEAGAGAFAFSADGETVIYSQSHTFQSTYRYLDLFARDLKTGGLRRLTHGERAREPAISPDGRRLAYVRNRAGTMELVVRPYPHVSGRETVLVSGLTEDARDPARWQQVATPAWSPDGRSLVFSWWRQTDGQRDLWVVDLAASPEERLRRLTDDFSIDVEPHWAADGRIYFSSDRNGIYNIYSIDPETLETRQISNVVHGAFSPRLSPDGRSVWIKYYGPKGYDLARIDNRSSAPVAPESMHAELSPVDYPDVATEEFDDRPYRPGRWLAPLMLQPEFGAVTTGAGLGASVVGFDPISHHQYSLGAGYTTGREIEDRSANAGIFYRYSGLPVALAVRGRLRDVPRTRSLFAGGDYQTFVEREILGRFAMSYPFRALEDTLSVSAAYVLEYTTFQNVPPIDHDPADVEPFFPEQGWFNELEFSLRYSSRESYPRSVTTSKGWSASVSLDVQDPAIGSTYRNLTFGYGFDVFLQNPVWPRHALGLFLDGAITTSELSSPRRYGIGGNTPQDILTSIVFQRQRRQLVIRGYPPGVTSGSQFQLVKGEYRFPILDLDEGLGTVPVFLRQIKGALFVDTGAAFDGFVADADFLTGIGGEILFQSVFAYYLFGNLRLGYARGIGENGINEFYALFGGGF